MVLRRTYAYGSPGRRRKVSLFLCKHVLSLVFHRCGNAGVEPPAWVGTIADADKCVQEICANPCHGADRLRQRRLAVDQWDCARDRGAVGLQIRAWPIGNPVRAPCRLDCSSRTCLGFARCRAVVVSGHLGQGAAEDADEAHGRHAGM